MLSRISSFSGPVSKLFKLASNIFFTTRGLILRYELSSNDSYTGNTTINDIIGNSNATLTNGPVYSSNGYFNFDGTNDYVDFFAPDLTTTATVEMWIKASSFSSNDMFFGWLTYDVITLTGSFGYNTNNSDIFGIPAATVTSLGLLNTWAHYVFERVS